VLQAPTCCPRRCAAGLFPFHASSQSCRFLTVIGHLLLGKDFKDFRSLSRCWSCAIQAAQLARVEEGGGTRVPFEPVPPQYATVVDSDQRNSLCGNLQVTVGAATAIGGVLPPTMGAGEALSTSFEFAPRAADQNAENSLQKHPSRSPLCTEALPGLAPESGPFQALLPPGPQSLACSHAPSERTGSAGAGSSTNESTVHRQHRHRTPDTLEDAPRCGANP
jgi:hypothetical protein